MSIKINRERPHPWATVGENSAKFFDGQARSFRAGFLCVIIFGLLDERLIRGDHRNFDSRPFR